MSSRGPVIGGVGLRGNGDRKHMHFDEPAVRSSSSYNRRNVEEISNNYQEEEGGGESENDESEGNDASDFDEEYDSKLPLFERLARSKERNENVSNEHSARRSQLKIKKNRGIVMCYIAKFTTHTADADVADHLLSRGGL